MIDFHSHILPGIDDGSPDEQESLSLLKALREQGVDTVCATSHFYIDHRSPESFLRRRQEAWKRLQAVLPDEAPRILLGAEVLYFPGISHLEELPLLCLQGTNVLLLEMPFTRWSEAMIREVKELALSRRVIVLMAHIDRYYYRQRRSVWDEFLEDDILIQANADFFLGTWTKRRALRLLREGTIQLLGSDCHNITARPPRLQEACDVIASALGTRILRDMDALGRELLGESVPRR